jgi:hypothetical protein
VVDRPDVRNAVWRADHEDARSRAAEVAKVLGRINGRPELVQEVGGVRIRPGPHDEIAELFGFYRELLAGAR